MKNVVEIKTCRLCQGSDLYDLFSLGEQYVNDFVVKEKINSGLSAPLDIVRCENCRLTQLKHNAPQELLYTRQYWYRSGVTDTMKRALDEIADAALDMVHITEKDVVLDIGANDGTFLESVKKKCGAETIACEPALNLQKELATRCDNIIDDFWSFEVFKKKVGDRKVKLITAIGMFYDLENPIPFVQDIEKALSDDGVFIAQLMTLAPMLKKNDIGNICHEHLEFYCYQSLKYLFEKSGLEIFKVEENDVNGGSYRIYARKFKCGSIPYPETVEDNDILDFKKRVDNNKIKTVKFIRSAVSSGKTVHVYGASTKGNVILQYYGLTSDDIVCAAERSPEKFNRYTIGSWIKILDEDDSRKLSPDFYFVLPYAFYDEMKVREQSFLEDGGKFILCTPQFLVDGKET